RAMSWDGIKVEIIQSVTHDKVEFCFRAPRHLLLVHEEGVRDEGETLVSNLPVSRLRALNSEGNVGLMQAVKRFNPEKGVRFASYAIWWIKTTIQEYILRSWSLVRIGTTANQKKLFFRLRTAKSKIS